MPVKKLLLHEIKNLELSREFLSNYSGDVILTNSQASTKYYGMMVLDYMFTALKKEFPQVKDIKVRIEDDQVARFTAIKLGYKLL